MKDRFSEQSKNYASFRPDYPPELVSEIVSHVPENKLAWDAGTGNGQLAKLLSPYFNKIIATDLSSEQLAQAPSILNVGYRIEPAEKCSLEYRSVDLLTVAQAVHWFDFEAFYAEVRRVLKPGGIVAFIGYPLFEVKNSEANELIKELYYNVLGTYWDDERKHLDKRYETIPFPTDILERIPIKSHSISYEWDANSVIGYINTWSALKNYRKEAPETASGEELIREISRILTNRTEVYFEMITLLGRVRENL